MDSRRDIQSLTPRQRDALRLRCAGKSTREIAEALGIAVVTVKNYLAAIRSRTGITDLSDMCGELVEQTYEETTLPK